MLIPIITIIRMSSVAATTAVTKTITTMITGTDVYVKPLTR